MDTTPLRVACPQWHASMFPQRSCSAKAEESPIDATRCSMPCCASNMRTVPPSAPEPLHHSIKEAARQRTALVGVI